jgi:adenylate cyclase
MSAAGQAALPRRVGSLFQRLLAIADEPGDDDDVRLRKRVGVIGGVIGVVLPFNLPVMAQGLWVAWVVALAMPLVSAVNLAVLARTRRFDRYVAVLILTVMLMPVFVEIALGGLAGSSAAILFAFLGPMYAILALGPRRATIWFVLFLAIVVAVVVIDPLVSSRIQPQPYPLRLVFYAANLGVPLTLAFVLLRYTDVRRRHAEARADELLTNAIPSPIATRLKRGEDRIAESYPATTVLFADLAGFTPWAQRTNPARVVSFLDALFTRFDQLAADCGVEKIKTIGDAYMAAGGVPEPRPDHAAAAVSMARGMMAALAETSASHDSPLALRIGIASGPAIGGVIGQRRIVFDLWGDTVNVASRMESTGVPGRIHIASSTRDLLDDRYAFEEREAVDVKGLGAMTTYLLLD